MAVCRRLCQAASSHPCCCHADDPALDGCDTSDGVCTGLNLSAKQRRTLFLLMGLALFGLVCCALCAYCSVTDKATQARKEAAWQARKATRPTPAGIGGSARGGGGGGDGLTLEERVMLADGDEKKPAEELPDYDEVA